MKILINALSARLGGGQTYIINLLNNLPDDKNLELLVLAPNSLALPQDKRIKRMGPKWPTTNPLARAVWERSVLPGILAKEKVCVLFCPGGVLGTKPPSGCRTVTMFRNMIPFDPRVRRSLPSVLQRIRNWMLESVMLSSMATADLVIFISQYARELIESRIHLKNAVTIPHGIPNLFRTHDKEISVPPYIPDTDYILYVSRFDVYKHHYELVTAFASLSPALRKKHKLILIGESDMPSGERVRQLISDQGLQNDVLILGAIKYGDLPAAYRNAKLILFASSCENCPNILLEAMGAGRPILSSSVQPMPEFGGDAVEYFNPFDPDDIAVAMRRVLTDPSLSADLAKKAALRGAEYDWGKTARVTWQHILSM